MLKSILVLLASVSFIASASAGYEVQISGNSQFIAGPFTLPGGGGTSGGITLSDDGTNDSTDFSLAAEVYMGMSENLQVGGLLSYGTLADGELTVMSLGALARYNLSTELRDSVFVGGGLRYTSFDAGTAVDNIAILLSVGKRYALSETLTWTPNLTIALSVAGDDGADEGHSIALNLLSFSGFLD